MNDKLRNRTTVENMNKSTAEDHEEHEKPYKHDMILYTSMRREIHTKVMKRRRKMLGMAKSVEVKETGLAM
nr:hypothetical protein Itr_chr10CG19060 [Ipomoea trifida]